MRERIEARLAIFILALDLSVTLGCLWVASQVRLYLEFGREITSAQTALPWGLYLAVAILWTIIFGLIDPHRRLLRSSLVEAIGWLVASIALAALTFAGMLYLSLRDVSRLQFLYFAGLNLSTLVLIHIGIRFYLQRRTPQTLHRRVLVVGEASTAERLADTFATPRWSGMLVAGYAHATADPKSALPYLGTVQATPDLVRVHQIDEVIFALSPEEHALVAHISLKLLQQPVMVHMIPDVIDLAFARTPVEQVGGIPLISLREPALTYPQRVLKRLFDLTASSLLLLLLAPLMLVIALRIRLESPGPVFFLQERLGEQGRRFRMLKFRSMYEHAEQRWHEVVTHDADGRVIYKLADDPRVTPFGRVLRRSSLDELPQLINVLRGEMSLVGPRPEVPVVAADYEPWQWQRFRVPPGMTGWWQINGRSHRPMHLHTEDDLYYIQNYSFFLDLQILFKTIIVVLQGKGAF